MPLVGRKVVFNGRCKYGLVVVVVLLLLLHDGSWPLDN